METVRAWTDARKEKVQQLIQKLYEIVHELEKEFEEHKRHFTPDGHLLGSLGEVIAAFTYNLDLRPSSTKKHDAKSSDGRNIQIKLTGGKRGISLSSEPDYPMVLQLEKTIGIQEIYNGSGASVWDKCKPGSKNGQRPISLKVLQDLNKQLSDSDRIKQFNAFPVHRQEWTR